MLSLRATNPSNRVAGNYNVWQNILNDSSFSNRPETTYITIKPKNQKPLYQIHVRVIFMFLTLSLCYIWKWQNSVQYTYCVYKHKFECVFKVNKRHPVAWNFFPFRVVIFFIASTCGLLQEWKEMYTDTIRSLTELPSGKQAKADAVHVHFGMFRFLNGW